jgi:transcriptional regulator with GAF, ATPase, and Fis domain
MPAHSLATERSRSRTTPVSSKLIAIKGPLTGSAFPVVTELNIGRDPANQLVIDHPSVAARHSRIAKNAQGFVLQDLDSASGTLLNGLPIQDRLLETGDLIAIGDSAFRFVSGGGDVQPEAASVQLDDAAGPSICADRLHQEDLLYLHPEELAALPASERLARTVNTLVKVSSSLASLRDVESLQWQLLGVIFDVIPAERAAILLCSENNPEEFVSTIAWDRVSGPDHPVHVSRALARRVLKDRVFVLDTIAGAHYHASQSVQNPEPYSLLCVPLVTPRRALGVIYLDTFQPNAGFTRDDLQLLAAIASLASLALGDALQLAQLGEENNRLRAEITLQHDMVGRSPRMLEVYRFIEKVAPSDSTVLIHGESGTGKELAARALHQNSPRRAQPFFALNCAALTESLLESELFGHERGAFTSAVAQKKGLLEMADRGTLFLDEVGELPLSLQAKLLRVLQEREFVRVGGTRPLRVNVRFVAATNCDLQKAVREEKFRLDLFYRLNVVSFTMPALRERPEDISVLADYFVSRFACGAGRRISGISPETCACLVRYDWPGNVRELENAIERAVVIGSSPMILPEDLPDAIVETAVPSTIATSAGYHEALLAHKKHLILQAFDRAHGSFTEAAKLLGVHPNYLHRLVRNLDLRASLGKSS